jgi:hypothetical protein
VREVAPGADEVFRKGDQKFSRRGASAVDKSHLLGQTWMVPSSVGTEH